RAGYAAEIVLLETATVTPGLVMQQSVPAGTVAPVGSVILLTVSTPPVLVPQPEVPQPGPPQPEVPQPAPDPAAPPVEDPAAPAP
ncbi:MAG: PASTA domain-containing protein, partial [Candidatus Nanopelagicales bacterium]